MAIVPRFNKTIIAREGDPGAIARAGTGARAIGLAADIGVGIRRAKDANFVNERSTKFEREVGGFFEQHKVNSADDPDGRRPEFDTFFNDKFAELSEGGSPEALQEFSRIKEDIKLDFDSRLDRFSNNQNISNFGKSFATSIDDLSITAFRGGQNGEDLLQSLNKIDGALIAGSTFISEGNLMALSDEARSKVSAEFIRGLIDSDPESAKERISKKEFDNLLEVEQIRALGISADRKVAFNEAEAERAEAERTQVVLDDILLKTFQAEDPENAIGIDQAQLEDMLSTGTIDERQFVGASRGLEVALKKREDRLLENVRITAFNNGTLLFDPNNKKDASAANTFYQKSFLPSIEGLPPEEQMQRKIDFVAEKEFIPDLLKSEITTNLYAGTPESQSIASNIINDLIRIKPTLARQFKDVDLAFSAKITDAINAGLTPDQATEFSESQTFLKGTPEFKARLTKFKEEKEDFNESEIQEFFRDDPENIPGELVQEWDTLYKFYATEQGVKDDRAQETAYNRIKSTWGVSRVTGSPEWIKWAPEKYYSVPNADNSWMKDQLTSIIQQNTLFESTEAAAEFVENNVEIVPDLRTVRSGKPAYRIVQRTETRDGNIVLDVLRGIDEQELFWIPSFAESSQAIEMENEHGKKTKTVRSKFQKIRERNEKRFKQFGFIPNEAKVIEGPQGAVVVQSVREGF